MEFLDYEKGAELFRAQGAVEHVDGDVMSMSIEDDKDATRRVVIGTAGEQPAGDDVRFAEKPRAELAEVTDAIVHRLHFNEIALMPAANWRAVLDIAAFQLANDEAWLDIDAEAAMHQTGRDPLVLVPNDRHLVKTIVGALMEHGDEPKHDLHVVGLESPFVMTVSHKGRLDIWCANDAVADMIIGVV